MTKILLYPRLAAGGIKRNRQTYLPYILTCSGMIMMYYIVSFLSKNSMIADMRGGEVMQEMLTLGCGVMIAFSAVFLFYTNSFLIRRRKKEFGLYNILGMGKRNIAQIMVCENLMVYVLSEALGIFCGILFSKLAELLALNIFGADISYTFSVESGSVINALAYYAVIFGAILVSSLLQVRFSNPVELLMSEKTGERPPRSNKLLAFAGLAVLAAAYYMAVTIENPISAIPAFFVAVLMVIAATYMLFIAGSVVICRILQSNKSYYYKTNHFVSVSQMVYRMKRGGAGLASICILSTMVLVTLSSTICLYIGEEDILDKRYPRDITVDTYSAGGDMVSAVKQAADAALEKCGQAPENEISYRYISVSGAFDNDSITLDPSDSGDPVLNDVRTFTFVPAEDYNAVTGNNVSLTGNDVIISKGRDDFACGSISIKELGTFDIVSETDDFVFTGESAAFMLPQIYVFVSDMDVMEDIYRKQFEVYGEKYASRIHSYYGFDLGCSDDEQTEVFEELHHGLSQLAKSLGDDYTGVRAESKANDKAEFYGLYSGLFFLGLILGTVFIFAAVLIMYYKQISEGYEDKARFEILIKVGMTRKEIRRSINSQVLTVFFLPLAAAGIHTAFAFPMISRMLTLFSLTNTGLYGLVTLICFGAFALLYVLAYVITSKSYYNIVSSGDE